MRMGGLIGAALALLMLAAGPADAKPKVKKIPVKIVMTGASDGGALFGYVESKVAACELQKTIRLDETGFTDTTTSSFDSNFSFAENWLTANQGGGAVVTIDGSKKFGTKKKPMKCLGDSATVTPTAADTDFASFSVNQFGTFSGSITSSASDCLAERDVKITKSGNPIAGTLTSATGSFSIAGSDTSPSGNYDAVALQKTAGVTAQPDGDLDLIACAPANTSLSAP